MNIAPIITIAIANMAIAMSTNDLSSSEIIAASDAYTREFRTQIVVGIIVAVILAYVTYRVWDAGNKLQDAINVNSQARIEEAKQGGEEAKLDAAKANEGLGNANLEIARLTAEAAKANKKTAQLSVKIEEEARRVAEAKGEAAKANERTERLEIEAATQREKAAKAELALEQIRKRQEPRRLTWDTFANALKNKPKGSAPILYQPDDGEGYLLAMELYGALAVVGWDIVSPPAPIPSNLIRSELQGSA